MMREKVVLCFGILAACLLAQIKRPPANPDYRHQLDNIPVFGQGFSIDKRQTGGDILHVQNAGALGVIVIPLINAEWPFSIAPGPCVYSHGKGTFREGVHFKSATMLQTPDAVYICAPDGTGKGFQWRTLTGSTSF